MVDKKELRIGNTIRCMHHLPVGFNAPLLIHSDIMEIREYLSETTDGFYKYKDIGPVPLTEDIILKSGIKKITDTEYIYSKSDENGVDVYLTKEMSSFFLSTEKGGKYSIAIENLHQLQNLFYILTGKELNINL